MKHSQDFCTIFATFLGVLHYFNMFYICMHICVYIHGGHLSVKINTGLNLLRLYSSANIPLSYLTLPTLPPAMPNCNTHIHHALFISAALE